MIKAAIEGTFFGIIVGSIFGIVILVAANQDSYLIGHSENSVVIYKNYDTRGDCLVAMEEKMKVGPTQLRLSCVEF